MPEGPEIETNELQEKLHELHHESHGGAEDKSHSDWIRLIATTTAILAVFAAVSSLQAGKLANEALISEIKSADAWNEYQASKQKSHIYSVAMYQLIDNGAVISPNKIKSSTENIPSEKKVSKSNPLARESMDARAQMYQSEIAKEEGKYSALSEKAKKLEEEGGAILKRHETFAEAVALMQVAIGLGAVAALTKSRHIWILGLVAGAIGIGFCLWGFLH